MRNTKQLTANVRTRIKADLAVLFKQFLGRGTPEEVMLLQQILLQWEQLSDSGELAAEEVPILSAFAAGIYESETRFIEVGEFELDAVVGFLRQLRSCKGGRKFQPMGAGWLLWKGTRNGGDAKPAA